MANPNATMSTHEFGSPISKDLGPFGPVFQLIPGVQMYDWGVLAKDGSLVAHFASSTDELHFCAKAQTPYAELWMGTHPSLPSKVIPPTFSSDCSNNYIELSSYLAKYPSLVGSAIRKIYGESQVPFLLKILSIRKALSIQAHPDKKLAKKLHAEKPQSYKDDNHKPEMAIALTHFQGFCGFRPLTEIATFLELVKEFRDVTGVTEDTIEGLRKVERVEDGKQYLRKIFTSLMMADERIYTEKVQSLAKRYSAAITETSCAFLEIPLDLAKLVVRLEAQYPRDLGVLCAFMLNVVDLKPMESIFLKANEPHAYLSGDIVECMATSDNVVRAGLTPKERDVEVLVGMLTYEYGGTDKQRMKTDEASDVVLGDASSSRLYDPPIEEFTVIMTHLSRNGSSKEVHRELAGPSIIIVTSGGGTLIVQGQERFVLQRPGQVFFIGAGTRIEYQLGESEDELMVYRAFVEQR